MPRGGGWRGRYGRGLRGWGMGAEADDWTEVTVAEIAAGTPNALSTGPFGSAIGAQYFEPTGVPIIRGGNLSEHVGVRLNDAGLVFLSPQKASEFGRSVVRQGDLIFTCWGTIGQVGLVDSRAKYREYVISNKQMKLTPDTAKADSLFLYYLFKSPDVMGRIVGQKIGSSVPGFNLGQLRAIRLRLPPLAEQRAIARIISALDDKIELNRKTIETLEAMARALFKSWFVDFDPVRAKMEGRRPEGMDEETAALFPGALEASELGPVPSGWRVEPLDAVASFLNGLALQKFPAMEGAPSLPVIKITELRRGNTTTSDRASTNVPPEYNVVDGDVLFSWSGSLMAVVWSGGAGALNQHLFKVTSDRFPRWLYYRWVVLHLPEFQAIAAGKATTMGHIQREHLTRALVAVPPAPLVARAGGVLAPLEDRRLRLALESRRLGSLRDALLPRLMSGELRVPDAERVMEAGT
ncbi:MAG: restriction endonuclease subunit S [Polyangiaceae bacterium]